MLVVLAAALLALPAEGRAQKKLGVVTTTQDLASIAQMIGGDRVRVEPLAKGYQDPHFVDAKPSYLLKLRKADVFIQVGRDLEVGWAPGLLNNARNSKIRPGGPGFVDASNGVKILEQGGRVGREMGDVHPLGNPHYWLDPENGLAIAANIRNAFSRNDPAGRAAYEARYAEFQRQLQARRAGWQKRAKALGLGGMKVVTYHRSWPYAARALGFEVLDFVEPRPGVPPTPKHVRELIELMKSRGVRLLIVEPYFDPKLPAQVARSAGVPVAIVPPSVGAVPEAKDYFSLFDAQLAVIQKALASGGPR
jgi:ABC-type Zn uptake system ZnuABC Zn-binding protein ZnuA